MRGGHSQEVVNIHCSDFTEKHFRKLVTEERWWQLGVQLYLMLLDMHFVCFVAQLST